MGKAGKQADRGKKVEKTTEADAPIPEGSMVEAAKSLAMGSILFDMVTVLPIILKEEDAPAAAPKEEEKEEKEEKEDSADAADADAKVEKVATDSASVFKALKERLAWFNGLGLAASPEEAKTAWLTMKGQELDFGPRPKKNGSPGIDRMTINLRMNMAQYVHILLALMILRAFLFRSFFACLPWLFGYQFLSLFLPLTNIAQLPQVPLEKCPLKFRVAATVGIHALVVLFFVFELVWKTNFLEKFLLAGVVLYHSYAVRPADAWSAKSS